MGTVPTPPTFAAGETLISTKLNLMRDCLSFWASPPQCHAYHSTTVNVPSGGSFTLIPLQTEAFDVVQSGDSPMHDNVTNNSRIYFRTAGKYEISGQLGFATNSTGRRIAQVRLNSGGSDAGGTPLLYTTQDATTGGSTSVPFPKFPVVAAVGDYIEMFGFQDSGGTLATSTTASFLWARFTAI